MGRDHSCPDCGRGGFNDPDGRCECDGFLAAGTIVENAHGARFRVEEDERDDSARVRAVSVAPVRSTKNAYAIGATTWLDLRDFLPGGLQVVAPSPTEEGGNG